MANAAVVSIGYERQWKQDDGHTRRLDAAFTVRAGSAALESDLVYRRYLGQGAYWHRWARHMVIVTGMAGGITGDAPLFERFSLGDSRTLRGWNKYDIAPAGADRMFHASVEYRYRGLALFLDSGSVWNRDTDRRFRVATGLGFHPGPVFFTVGFPVNTDELRAVFTMGISLSVGMRYY
jgi:outer membrane protein assembly factor BamA